MIFVALDIDGTLVPGGGPITKEQIELLTCPGVTWGILSSRSKRGAQEACTALGVAPAFIEVCRVDMRAEELKLLAERYPADRYIYVGDRDIDRLEALRAGWGFCFAVDFPKGVEEWLNAW